MVARRRAVLTVSAGLLCLAALAGCGDQPAPSPRAEDPTPSAEPSESARTEPALPEVIEWDGEGFAPPVTLDLDGERVPLKPWAACYENTCVDGFSPPPYFDVGDRGAVAFSFPDEGWEFEATFKEAGVEKCGRQLTVPVRKTSAHTWVVKPVGPADDWDVELFGRGPGEDVVTTFSWSTDVDGRLPGPPSGSAAVLADNDPGLDSYGVEIGVRNLASQPRRATAEVMVTSADDQSITIPTKLDRPCYDEGSLWFTASDEQGRRATQLGDGPFTYTVKLNLDGTTYTGVGEWPTGETEDIAPHVPLTWTPALPAYTLRRRRRQAARQRRRTPARRTG